MPKLNFSPLPHFVSLDLRDHALKLAGYQQAFTNTRDPFRTPLRLLCFLIVTYSSTVGPALGRGSGWAVLDTQRSFWAQTKTAPHYSCVRRCFAPHVALMRPILSRFALHFARLNGHLDSGFLVRTGSVRSSLRSLRAATRIVPFKEHFHRSLHENYRHRRTKQ